MVHTQSDRASKPVWYRSLYWRVGLGFVAFLAVLLIAQALVFVWLVGVRPDGLPVAPEGRLAELIASDVASALEADKSADIAASVARAYGATAPAFLVVMRDGRVVSNRDVPPGLLRATRTRLARMAAGQPVRRAAIRPRFEGGRRLEAPILVRGELTGLVVVLPGRPSLMAVLRPLAPTLALSGLAVLVLGAAAAALLIFGPVRRRLRHLEDAAARIGAGETGARAPDHGGDEVAALARSFNRMAGDLEARAAALAASDKARRQLLADVSHELMTPLTAMRGYLETLAMAELKLDPPTRERYLRIVDEETRRLERIIGDLLDLARLEGGGSTLRREFVDTRTLFERVALRHERELTERGVRLVRRVEPGAEQLAGDPDRLEQALQNLAANALRHTRDGGEIALIAEPAPRPFDRLRVAPSDVEGRLRPGQPDRGMRIVVRDTGPGIAPEHLPRIFDRFYKADASRAGLGSGLGLSIVKAIVERHGGTMTVRNDGGAVFEILLPAEGQTPVTGRTGV